MPKEFFNFFAGKDAPPPAPEKRVIPSWAKNIKSPIEGWITTQVFVDKKDKSKRVYYAAQTFADGEWVVAKYTYSSVSDHDRHKEELRNERHNIGAATCAIAELEKRILEEGHVPVAGLHGNYREAANLNGAYIDDKGDYIVVTKDEPVITKDALIDRKGIQAMYSKAAEKPAEESFIKTWDDFYRVIVHKYPPEALACTPLPEWFVKCSREMIGEVNDLNLKVRDPHASLQEKLLARNCAHCRGVKADGFMEAEYAFHVVQLTALMRAGSEVFRQLPDSLARSAENMELLKEIGETIRHFVTIQHSKNFRLPPEQAEQLVNIMMQGPDPYADKPLPLEEILGKYAPSQKPDPKQPRL
ncbi:MAG: hypothetical protein K8R48_04430 [Alphaproteobacteria bacterium]|nr:hypothetical protein [Alphaproteobacteria bacterium]